MDSDGFAIRFGFGLPANAIAPASMLAALKGPDRAMAAWPGATLAEFGVAFRSYRAARKAKDEAALRLARRQADMLALDGAKATFARAAGSDDPFRERLVAFWADHFTVAPKARVEMALPGILIDDAIRPHVAGRFADMLRAVITHPAMLLYLNQDASVGPGSPRGLRQKKGLNENLARELLELHTLGVGAAYSQTDVRQLAELLTGLAVSPEEGFVFDPRRAEPGAETVLGRTYDGKGIEPVLQVLDDLATRPETAAHLARKLAVHFVADTPDPALAAALAAVFAETGGDLAALGGVLLTHPAALAPGAHKARQPFDFLVASLRALQVRPTDILAASPKDFRRLILDPLEAMGQPLHRATGPDGWPEGETDWITPQGLAARIDWAMAAPVRLVSTLPDPRSFLSTALGGRAGETLQWAVSAAESSRDGVGIVLASPDFNRR